MASTLKLSNRWPARIFVLVFVLGLAGMALWNFCFPPEIYSRTQSPDGRYALVVLRRPLLFCFPGGSSDAPGEVRLLDKDNRVLRRVRVEMVQQMDRVEWRAGEVDLGEIGIWPIKGAGN